MQNSILHLFSGELNNLSVTSIVLNIIDNFILLYTQLVPLSFNEKAVRFEISGFLYPRLYTDWKWLVYLGNSINKYHKREK